MPKRKLIEFTIPTDPELSVIDGRNGCFRIQKLYVWESHDHRHVYIDGIGRRGIVIKGGLRVTLECFKQACLNFQKETAHRDGFERYRQAAKNLHHREGEIEIDNDAVVSKGNDNGAYVQAWVWVSDEDLELEKLAAIGKIRTDCEINAEGFCETHQTVHLRERAAEMGIPAAAERCERIPDEEVDDPKTVLQAWNMRCPKCKSDESIEISANVYVRLKPDGTDIFDTHNGDHEWDNDSTAYCAACGFSGTVRDFEKGESNDVR